MTDEKKPNSLTRYLRETTGELRKVSWPTRAEAIQLTIIVLAVMTVMGLYLALIDEVALKLIDLSLGV